MRNISWKQTIRNVGMILFLLLAILMVFHDHWQSIWHGLAQVPVWGVALLIALGLLSTLLDALAHRALIRPGLPDFSVLQSVRLLYLGIFGNVATLAAGTLPLQSHYLHKRGMMAGAGIGTILLEYVFHKTTVLLYAGGMLLIGGHWLHLSGSGYAGYLAAGYVIATLIIVFLVLLCTSSHVQKFLRWLVGRFPEKGVWAVRKPVWNRHLEALTERSHEVLQNKKACAQCFLLTVLKLFVLYSIPYACFRLLDVSILSYGASHLITALMLLLTGAIPNIGGMGPTEAAFLFLFSPYVGRASALSALILYRIATYFVPFLLSMAVFFHYQKHNIP